MDWPCVRNRNRTAFYGGADRKLQPVAHGLQPVDMKQVMYGVRSTCHPEARKWCSLSSAGRSVRIMGVVNQNSFLPPSTGIMLPVVKVNVVARASTALATSSGVARRPMGVRSVWGLNIGRVELPRIVAQDPARRHRHNTYLRCQRPRQRPGHGIHRGFRRAIRHITANARLPRTDDILTTRPS